MLFLLPLGFDVVSPTHWNKIIYSYTHKVSKVSFSLSHIYLYSSKHTHSHTRSSRRNQRGRCCSWVFDPPAATTAGWLTFCLIMYKWSISRCVPAAARGLLFGLLHLDIVIFTPQTFDWCWVWETYKEWMHVSPLQGDTGGTGSTYWPFPASNLWRLGWGTSTAMFVQPAVCHFKMCTQTLRTSFIKYVLFQMSPF